jgi:hypothetical protein
VRFPVGNLLVPGLLFMGLQSAPPEEPVAVPELSHAEAWDRILSLPEVRLRAIYYPLASAGEVGLIVMDDGDEAPGIWVFYIGEDHPTHTVRNLTMRVSSYTGEISVWDTALDSYVELELWRKGLSH